MFRAVLVNLAKRKPVVAPPRRKALKHVVRRGSSVSLRGPAPVKGRRSSSPPPPKRGGRGHAEEVRNAGGAALVKVSSEEPSTRLLREVAPPAKPAYRLATAVSTIIVPPTANMYLEGMKQTLTPAARRPRLDTSRDGAAATTSVPVAPMEEYYTGKKGPLFATAVIAGNNAVKQASMLVPFCHPIPIQRCSFTFRRRAVAGALRSSALPHRVVLRKRSSVPLPRPSPAEYSILYCFCTVATEENKTGVEIEALTGATVAGITLYDMLKGLPGAQEDGLALGEAFILAKRGGRSDFIKLLMSDPDQSTPRALPSTAAEATNTTAASADGAAATDAKPANTREGDVEEEPAAEDSGRIVRRTAPAAIKRADAQPTTDSAAWWRSSKHEKKLQELYPRRKYGDGARLAPPEKLSAGKKPQTPAVEEVEDDEPELPTPPETKSGTVSRAKGKASRKQEPEEEPDAEEAVEEEPEQPVRSRKTRGGQLSRKSSRATVKETYEEPEAAEEAAEEAEEEEEEPVPPPRRLAPARVSKAAAVRRKSKEPVPEVDDEDEEEMSSFKQNRRRATTARPEVPEDDEGLEETPRGKGGMRPVRHDDWSHQTRVVEPAETALPPLKKKLKRRKSVHR